MSKHVRQQIREAAVAQLKQLPATAGRVYTGDPYAKPADDGAHLVVGVPEEAPNTDYDDLGTYRGRRALLLVVGYAEAILIEDALDDIALQVEAALEGSLLGGLAKDINFARMSKVIDDAGKKRSGEVRMEFAVDYRIKRGQPATAVG